MCNHGKPVNLLSVKDVHNASLLPDVYNRLKRHVNRLLVENISVFWKISKLMKRLRLRLGHEILDDTDESIFFPIFLFLFLNFYISHFWFGRYLSSGGVDTMNTAPRRWPSLICFRCSTPPPPSTISGQRFTRCRGRARILCLDRTAKKIWKVDGRR